jgi:abortive infection bacteriophage resistance protein
MDKEVLVGEILTDEMIRTGRKLINDIKDSNLKIEAAFWLYFPEAEEWRLVLVSPRVDLDGSRKLYEELAHKIYKGIDKLYGLELRNFTFLSTTDPLVRTVAGANRHLGLDNSRLSGIYLNGDYIDDLYLYFISNSIRPLRGMSWYI